MPTVDIFVYMVLKDLKRYIMKRKIFCIDNSQLITSSLVDNVMASEVIS